MFLAKKRRAAVFAICCGLVVALGTGQRLDGRKAGEAPGSPVGMFEGRGDVGAVLHPGKVDYDAAKQTYTISGSGTNMWLGRDEFQFVWKKMSGDVTLTADIAFLGKGVNEHRKAVLMIRESLETDSPYADVAVHGSGLTSLQYREEKGALTHQIEPNVSAPQRVRLEKRGNYYAMWLADGHGRFHPAGGSTRVLLKEPFYVGIGVCSHDKDVVETAVFSNVNLKNPNGVAAQTSSTQTALYSTMELISIDSGNRKAIYVAPGRFEAPNWMPDGKFLLFNRNGYIEEMPISGGPSQTLDTGFATRCNNDHGVSPDGSQLVISDQSQENHQSLIYILPVEGGTPRRITKNSPSYWHGWSPDGKTLAFVGERNDDFDIYAISVEGGEEKRLTTAPGLDDGPEYTPNGQYIYFNSERTGHMQIWRMKPDGSEQEQVTFGEDNDWFPHFSPDGQWMVFLSFDKNVKGHPENKDVMLRLMSMKDKRIMVLARLFGGQGTINVPSWSPDSKQLAFVSYQLAVPEDSAE